MALTRDLIDQLNELLRPLRNKIANTVARSVVNLIDDAQALQSLQIGAMAGENLDDAERFQEYGFSSAPLSGAEAVAVFPNGDRSHPLVVATDDRRHRPTGLAAGEVVLYSHNGDQIKLEDGNIVTVTAGTTLRLGGATATDAVVKGTTYRGAEDSLFSAIGTFATAVATAAGVPAAGVTLNAAIAAFTLAASTYLSTKVTTE